MHVCFCACNWRSLKILFWRNKICCPRYQDSLAFTNEFKCISYYFWMWSEWSNHNIFCTCDWITRIDVWMFKWGDKMFICFCLFVETTGLIICESQAEWFLCKSIINHLLKKSAIEFNAIIYSRMVLQIF